MFIYLVALVATFLIFGFLHVHHLNDWLQSSIRCSLTLYSGLICRPGIGDSLNNVHLEHCLLEGPETLISERIDTEDCSTAKTAVSSKDRSSEVPLEKDGYKARCVNYPRYSFENMQFDERDKDLGLTATRNLQLGTTQEDAIRTSKQEGKENIFETLKNATEKASLYSPTRLNTRQIYNLLLKETQKENETKLKSLDSENSKFNETTPIKMEDQFQSLSENRAERENTNE